VIAARDRSQPSPVTEPTPAPPRERSEPQPLPKTEPPADRPPTDRSPAQRETRVRMTRLRRRIAERLKEAQQNAAMLTTFNEIDMSGAIALRERWREAFEKKHGVRLGFMSIFVKAAIVGLKESPAVNAEIDGEDIVYKNHYDIGVAVGTEQGLVVPVVRDADARSFAEIEKEIAALGHKARDGKLTIEDLSGGTFTISNGGVYGSLLSTPILNPPQSAILGMHKIERRPVAVGDPGGERIEIRPMMYVALTYDHRIIDGREAVTFLVRIKECVEDPSRLLFEI
jgi:2-oxoglutarate dehydrogenase E2 component (dihydrolipoamide succinyltransferase)